VSTATFRKILIANRGEIAVRVIQACRGLGIRTVAIASEVGREAPHPLVADEVHMLGGPCGPFNPGRFVDDQPLGGMASCVIRIVQERKMMRPGPGN
jgi:pyruvate carboxylase